MQHRDTDWLRAALAATLAICVGGSGCSTFPHTAALGDAAQDAAVTRAAGEEATTPRAGGSFMRVAATVGVLQPRSEVFWSIQAGQPPSTLRGPAVVGPDGTLVLGPYGVFAVAGLTAEQARVRIERQLSRQVRNAKVELRLVEVARAADRGGPAPAAKPAPRIMCTWRPVQRDAGPSGPMFVPAGDKQFATAAPPAVRTSNWQPAGALQRVSDTGPELGPAPRSTGPILAGPPLAGPPLAGPPLGPVVGLPDGAPVGPPMGPPPGPLVGPHPPATPFGMGHAPNEGHKLALPRYVIAPPDILQIDSLEGLLTQPVRGPHLVRPDGTVGLGVYGSAFVAGLTVDLARVEIARVVHGRLDPARRSLKDVLDGLSVDVLAYNSRVYYIITNRLGFGTIVDRLPITGSETVLDAISQLRGLPPEAAKSRIWVARKVPKHGGGQNILPVDWFGITKRGEMQTNYQLLPGDRVFVEAEGIQKADFWLSKWLSPIQRLFGATLLGSETVNSIRSGSTTAGR